MLEPCVSQKNFRLSSISAVPNIFGIRDWFRGIQFFHGWGVGDGFGMIEVHYFYCALYFYYYYIVIHNEITIQLIIMLTGDGTQEVMRVMGSGCKCRWSFTCSPAAHLLPCGPVPNRPQTSTGPWPRGWGPLLYIISNKKKPLPLLK